MSNAPARNLTATVVVLTLAGCGSGSPVAQGSGSPPPSPSTSPPPLEVVRAAARATNKAGPSRFDLTTTTKVEGQTITFRGTGAFDPAQRAGTATFELPNGAGTLEERFLGDMLYLKLPNQPAFYAVKFSDLIGTPLAGAADPTASAQLLDGVGDTVTVVGPETVRGAKTTRYRGTIDVQKALSRLQGAARDLAQKAFAQAATQDPPFDVWIADDGTTRRFEQTVDVAGTAATGGQPLTVTTRLEMFDFGTQVQVAPPPADQVQDGAPLIKSLSTGQH